MKPKERNIIVFETEEELNQFMEEQLKKLSKNELKKPLTATLLTASSFRKFLTQSRLHLLRTIKAGKPGSIYELSKMVGRDKGNVAEDLEILANLGLIKFEQEKGGRKIKKPAVDFDILEVRIPIKAARENE